MRCARAAMIERQAVHMDAAPHGNGAAHTLPGLPHSAHTPTRTPLGYHLE